MNIEGEEYKQEPKRKSIVKNKNESKESYDNILIMESIESLTDRGKISQSRPLLWKNDDIHMNWSEVDDEDTSRRGDISKLEIAESSVKHQTTIDPRGPREAAQDNFSY